MKKAKSMMAAVIAAAIGLIPFSGVTTTAMAETVVSSGTVEETAAEDSLNISEEIKDNFRKYERYADPTINPERRLVQDFRSIMALYSVPLTAAFTDFDNIDDILASNEMGGKYYVVEYDDGDTKFYDEELKECISMKYSAAGDTLPYIYRPEKSLARFWDTDFVMNYVSPDAVLENIYYLSGETYMMGTAIYYRTSVGDYVYYLGYTTGEAIFPLSDFCAYQQAVRNELSEEYDGGGASTADFDMSDYALIKGNGIADRVNVTVSNVKGDANCDGKLTVSDAVAVLQYIANAEKYPLSDQARFNADIDGEEGVTGGDAIAIQRIDAGIWDES